MLFTGQDGPVVVGHLLPTPVLMMLTILILVVADLVHPTMAIASVASPSAA